MHQINEIHIVSFNIPYPPNYGGVIDVFYKIKALYELGIKINLHCFKYDRQESSELEKHCKSVNYYDRPKTIKHFFSNLPFIVKTRNNKALFSNLIQDSKKGFISSWVAATINISLFSFISNKNKH